MRADSTVRTRWPDSSGDGYRDQTATCNGSHTAGCSGHHPTIAVGRGPQSAVVDTRTDTVYVANWFSADVSVINGSRCNATVTRGCGTAPRELVVGSEPQIAEVNPSTHTLYVTLFFPFPNGPLAIVKI